MKYFIGGFTWGSGSQLKRFLTEGIWENGYGTEKYSEKFKLIGIGDRFALKSTSVKNQSGHKTSYLRIIKTGVVTDILSESKIKIDWDPSSKEFDLLDIKWYAKTLEEITNPKDITRIFYNTKNNQEIDSIVQLLQYKHQIILQGPPGTGKTYMAKKIAQEMTKSQSIGSPSVKIDNFFKTFNSSESQVIEKREELSNLLTEFQHKFPKEQVINLTLESYTIGTGSNDSFCWWIERGLKELGYYFPGSSRSYLIYWNKNSEEYSTHYKHSKALNSAKDVEDAMRLLAKIISDLVINKKSDEAFKILGASFILKIFHSYYPNEFFPVNSVHCLENILKLMNIDYANLNFLEMNLKVQELFNNKKTLFKANITSHEFMRFLFDNFDLKGEISIKEESVITKGEYKLIQFHPAYSYEDFVRGISAKTNEQGNIYYEVENKILSQFAEKAIKNPSANFVLIIDEINRANLPSVLGELIYALEYRYDKDNPDSTSVDSMYTLKLEGLEEDDDTNKKLKIPDNLYIIGTMNTADRSAGHIDYAIRRRFAFKDVIPSSSVIDEVVIDTALNSKAKALYHEVASLFHEKKNETDMTLTYLAPDFKAKEVQLGHSYFLAETEEILKLKLDYEIKPLLREYLKDGVLLDSAKDKIENLNV